MTFDELKKTTAEQNQAIVLDSYLPKTARSIARNLLLSISAASFIFSIIAEKHFFEFYQGVLADGVTLVSLGLALAMFQLEAFYHSRRFYRLPVRLPEAGFAGGAGVSYQVALILRQTDEFDATFGFINSSSSRRLLARLVVDQGNIASFLSGERSKISQSSLFFESDFISFADYASVIYGADESLRVFLSSHAVSEKDFKGAALWETQKFEKGESRKRFWSRENLEAVPSVGTALSYGFSFEAGKWCAVLGAGIDLRAVDIYSGFREAEVLKLENALSRREEANAVIVDDEESSARDILVRLLKKMKSGVSLAALEHKNILELEWNALLSEIKNKTDFEKELLKILREAAMAGNIIIYIPNFPGLILSARNIGSNPSSLFEEFFKSNKIQLVAHSTKTDFHYFMETNSGLVSAFERIIPEEESEESSMPALIEKAETFERELGVFFSYQALVHAAHAAENYITYGEMPAKALELLSEIALWTKREKIKIITKADVAAFVSNKTGAPAGEISAEESSKLTRLEEILHRRIIGQEAAVSAVSGALRRARSGIANSKRPLASFLFLGSTGVGKTETSKALAEVFFGSAGGKMLRVDMSEFNGVDALPRLIGSWGENKTGILASKIRDNPYGVLLLDEFEKAASDVLDLFLQILDEGLFTDALGKQVNCRNLIIIATSNAGSQTIWEMVRQGENLEAGKDKVIDNIVEKGIFKPELLNRFDGLVVFRPLERDELRLVAEMMFDKFKNKMEEEKQIKISAGPTLLDYLVSRGADREFGARSINRIIQEKVENFVANKIISGELKAGSSIEIKAEHLNMA